MRRSIAGQLPGFSGKSHTLRKSRIEAARERHCLLHLGGSHSASIGAGQTDPAPRVALVDGWETGDRRGDLMKIATMDEPQAAPESMIKNMARIRAEAFHGRS